MLPVKYMTKISAKFLDVPCPFLILLQLEGLSTDFPLTWMKASGFYLLNLHLLITLRYFVEKICGNVQN
jgi:hypothetical protein